MVKKGGGCGCDKLFSGGKKKSKKKMSGGICTVCGMPKYGGNSSGFPVSVMPGPFIGKPWGPQISQWPSTDGISADRNYLSQNLYNHGDPQTSMLLNDSHVSKILGGGKKHKKKRKSKKKIGGSFVQDLVNFGRSLEYNLQSGYNTIKGYSQPTNPLPFIQNKIQ
uniref:Uncharacterized protein n=1 Tax=viral metagenome TaxID=1070528 RepID=A0A6C0H590_9ZZZZ